MNPISSAIAARALGAFFLTCAAAALLFNYTGSTMRAAHAAAGAHSGSEAAGPRFLLFQSGRTMAPSLAGIRGSFRVFTKAEMDEPVDEIIANIGERGDGAGRQLGIAFGPLSFDMTDAQLRTAIGNAFAIAEQKNVAVAFHIDDSMFWYNRADLWPDRNNVEWSDWNGTVVPHRIIGWVLDGRPVLAPPMCYNSPVIKAEAERLAREVIGAEIRRGLEHLYGIGKPYLFAGVIAGWETRLQDNSQPQVFYGYCALRNLGYSAATPPADIDAVLQDVVKDWVTLWTRSLYQAGIPRDRIFTHNGTPTDPPGGVGNPSRRFYKNADPSITAFTEFSYPGFSVYAGSIGIFAALQRKFGQRLGSSWGIAEGTVVTLGDPFRGGLGGSGLTPEQFLASAYNGGAVFVNIFGWGDGNERFSRPAKSPAAIAAYRKFLRGERFAAAPIAAAAPPRGAVASPREDFLAKLTDPTPSPGMGGSQSGSPASSRNTASATGRFHENRRFRKCEPDRGPNSGTHSAATLSGARHRLKRFISVWK